MATTKTTASFRCDRELLDRMVKTSKNHGLSLSEWMRRSLEDAVSVHLPRSTMKRWKEAELEDREMGAFFAGKVSKLPENLIGEAIEARNDQGDTWTAVIDEVRFRSDRMAIVKIKPNTMRRQSAAVEPAAA